MMEDRIYNLVKEQFENMTFSNKESNQARLANRCQNIICNELEISNNEIWKLIDEYVKEFIPDEMD